jgi:hypothetical protein
MAPLLLSGGRPEGLRTPEDGCMKHPSKNKGAARSWKSFIPRDGVLIERCLRFRITPCCPSCGDLLEAQEDSRIARELLLDATAFDLSCRPCRRFWTVVRHTPRSLRLSRMRRFVAAVAAIGDDHRHSPNGGAPIPVATP